MKEKNSTYIFGFVDKYGEAYDYHVSDDLDSIRTWESIDFKFSLPDSKYILIWRRDRKKFTNSEANTITDYVKDDMQEYMSEGKDFGNKENQIKISSMLVPSKECLILAYNRMILPPGNINWKNFADLISFEIDDMVELSIQGENNSEKIEDVLEGSMFDKKNLT